MNNLLGRSLVLLALAAGFLNFVAKPSIAAQCAVNSPNSKLSFIDDNDNIVELAKFGSRKFKLDGDLFKSGRKLHFFGKIKSPDNNNDFMIVVKIRGLSSTATKNTTYVTLSRKAMNRRESDFIYRDYPLDLYSKHHFPKQNNRENDYYLTNNFHTPYIFAGQPRHTDDFNQRDVFQFDGVGNTWKGSFLARLFQGVVEPKDSIAEPSNSKYVYLQASIGNLKHSPCFSFSTYIPRNVDDLFVEVVPIDLDQRSGLQPETNQWQSSK